MTEIGNSSYSRLRLDADISSAEKRLTALCPENVVHLLDIFRRSGETAYLVGGCVRDTIMGTSPHDWDIAVTTSPDMTITICDKHSLRTIPTGITHGTVTVLLDDGTHVEATSCRTDGSYSDSRHPDNVKFTGRIEDDLGRRDFTVNAMAATLYGKDSFKIIDIFEGIDDLRRGRIRCVGDSDKRFSEDALRILRAVRFASRFNFEIEHKTRAAILLSAHGLKNISRERISSEFEQMITSKTASRALSILSDLGLMPYILANNNAFKLNFNIFNTLPQSYPIRLSALLLGSELGEDSYRYSLDGLKPSNIVREECLLYYRAKETHLEKTPLCARILRRDFGKHAQNVLCLISVLGMADSDVTKCLLHLVEESEKRVECVSIQQLAVNGNELINFGIPPGKILGSILNELLFEVLKDPSLNKAERLLPLAEKIFIYSPKS